MNEWRDRIKEERREQRTDGSKEGMNDGRIKHTTNKGIMKTKTGWRVRRK